MPESMIQQGSVLTVNYLSLFLAKGGHLFTLGRSDWQGGLAAILTAGAQMYPMSLRCEITGNQEGCEGDTSGVNCMAYKDYCISMLDKVTGTFRNDEDMPRRRLVNYDVMQYAYRDDSDPVTADCPGLPPLLELWEEVTKSTSPPRYFDPNNTKGPGGFTYVEIYDPEYWMERNYVESQPCFHPMYRMVARNNNSAVDSTTVAIWVTKYEDIEPRVRSGIAVAAPSFHFGLPLWFFDRADVDSIIDVIFDKWEILAEQE